MKNKKVIVLIIITVLGIVSYIISHFFIFSRKVNSITIKFAYGQNVSVVEKYKDDFKDDIVKIDLNGEELEQVSSLIKKISFKKVSNVGEAICGTFMIVVNDDYTILFDNSGGYALYSKNNESSLIRIPSELYNLVNEIINKEIGEDKK